MKQAVMIKSFPNGIALVCSNTHSFLEIVDAIQKKLSGSVNFFVQSKLSLRLEGRVFTQEERVYLTDLISQLTGIEIVTVIDQSEQDLFVQNHELQNIMEHPEEFARYYQGPISGGRQIEDVFSIVVIGDVHAGCSLKSKGNIQVLGTLAGEAHAGCEGRRQALISADKLEDADLRIADRSISGISSKKPVRACLNKDQLIARDYQGKSIRSKKRLF